MPTAVYPCTCSPQSLLISDLFLFKPWTCQQNYWRLPRNLHKFSPPATALHTKPRAKNNIWIFLKGRFSFLYCFSRLFTNVALMKLPSTLWLYQDQADLPPMKLELFILVLAVCMWPHKATDVIWDSGPDAAIVGDVGSGSPPMITSVLCSWTNLILDIPVASFHGLLLGLSDGMPWWAQHGPAHVAVSVIWSLCASWSSVP